MDRGKLIERVKTFDAIGQNALARSSGQSTCSRNPASDVRLFNNSYPIRQPALAFGQQQEHFAVVNPALSSQHNHQINKNIMPKVKSAKAVKNPPQAAVKAKEAAKPAAKAPVKNAKKPSK